MEQLFNEGDVVQLKSGTPKMTIREVRMQEGKFNGIYYCVWFDGQYLFYQEVHQIVLEAVK